MALAGFVAFITVSLPQIIQAYPQLALNIEKRINNEEHLLNCPDILQQYFEAIDELSVRGSKINKDTSISLSTLYALPLQPLQ